MDCIFCKIVAGDIPSAKVYEDDAIYAFRDISPQAPVHILVIPKDHVLDSAAQVNGETAVLMGKIHLAIAAIARQEGLDCGYRIVTNVGEDAGQTVHHLHFHILGGEKLGAMA